MRVNLKKESSPHMAMSSTKLNEIIHNQNLFMSLKLHLIFQLRCLYQPPAPTIRPQQLRSGSWSSHACPFPPGGHLCWLAGKWINWWRNSRALPVPFTSTYAFAMSIKGSLRHSCHVFKPNPHRITLRSPGGIQSFGPLLSLGLIRPLQWQHWSA